MSTKLNFKPKSPKRSRNTCPGCRKVVERLFSIPVGKKQILWHPRCFLCSNCKVPLANAQYFLQKNAQSSPYCLRCNNQMFSKKCAGCCKSLTKFGCLAMDVCWHRNCFKCQLCYNPISKQYYLLEKNRPICYECHKKPPDCYADMAKSTTPNDGDVMTPLSRKPVGPLTLAIFSDPRFPIAEESIGTEQSHAIESRSDNSKIPMEKLPELSFDDFGLLVDQEVQSTTRSAKEVKPLITEETLTPMKCVTVKASKHLEFGGLDIINEHSLEGSKSSRGNQSQNKK